ncbi:MAG: glycosyltransferase family 1 protein, partial [Gemmatimonadota bacterium]|nr:glycosyltransferase family 1 protein [Gemmatimonadota bacterium]
PEDPIALARAITATLDNRVAAGKRVAAARARLAESYDFDAWLDQYDAVYDRVRPRREPKIVRSKRRVLHIP